MTETIEDVAPSAKLVYKVLEYDGPLTQKGIAEESKLPRRTVRSALEDLRELDLVSEDVYLPDARQRLYRLDAGIAEDEQLAVQ